MGSHELDQRAWTSQLGVGVDFYWFGEGPIAQPGIDAAIDALMAAVSSPARRWNPYNEVMTRREFAKRLEAACRGELVPVDEVKPIDDPTSERLFEIRWSSLNVKEQHSGETHPRHLSIEVRLLHAEPEALGVVAIGLHAHEKAVFPGDARATRDAQDQHIHEAIVRYNAGLSTRWGISAG